MPNFNEEELKEKLKQIESEYKVDDISFWPTVFKRVLLIIGAFVVFVLVKAAVRYIT